MPKVEPVDVAKFELATPRSRAQLSGDTKVWDFTAGIPAGGKVMKHAVCDARGLRATAPTNRDAAGRELDGAGWVCLQGGSCTVDIVTNIDDPAGDYRLVCCDRASGFSVERKIERH